MPSLLLGWPNRREGEQRNLHIFSDNTFLRSIDNLDERRNQAYRAFAPFLFRGLAWRYCPKKCVSFSDNAIPVESIAKMMGHSSIASTQIYAQITNQKIARDMDRLMEKV